eukprot:111034-Hanusia_phi.AAC.1
MIGQSLSHGASEVPTRSSEVRFLSGSAWQSALSSLQTSPIQLHSVWIGCWFEQRCQEWRSRLARAAGRARGPGGSSGSEAGPACHAMLRQFESSRTPLFNDCPTPNYLSAAPDSSWDWD